MGVVDKVVEAGREDLLKSYIEVRKHVHALMRDEDGRKKKASKRSNKQGKATQHTQGSHFS